MIKEKDLIVGNKFFFRTWGKGPVLVKIIGFKKISFEIDRGQAYSPTELNQIIAELEKRDYYYSWSGQPDFSQSGIIVRGLWQTVFYPGKKLEDTSRIIVSVLFSKGNIEEVSLKNLFHCEKEAKKEYPLIGRELLQKKKNRLR